MFSWGKKQYGISRGEIEFCRRTRKKGERTTVTNDHIQNKTFRSSTWIHPPIVSCNIFMCNMEHNPPIPTLHPTSSKYPLHTFLGFHPGKQIVSLSARDPDDGREMPPNGSAVVSVWTLRYLFLLITLFHNLTINYDSSHHQTGVHIL